MKIEKQLSVKREFENMCCIPKHMFVEMGSLIN